jgi:hypothetical protein
MLHQEQFGRSPRRRLTILNYDLHPYLLEVTAQAEKEGWGLVKEWLKRAMSWYDNDNPDKEPELANLKAEAVTLFPHLANTEGLYFAAFGESPDFTAIREQIRL